YRSHTNWSELRIVSAKLRWMRAHDVGVSSGVVSNLAPARCIYVMQPSNKELGMARMYPQRLLDAVKSPAEQAVYTILATHLPNDFVVFHNVRWLAKSRAGGAVDGETDFLIAHPDYGVLVIEVKGGTIRYDGATGAWTSTDRNGVVYDIDPFGQARRAQYSL